MTKISAGIICAREEPFIHLTLQSLVGVVDEVVLVGDPDKETRGRINEGKKIADYDFTFYWRDWTNEYGKAREYALNKCKHPWVLQIDADECLSDDGFELRKLTEASVKPAYHIKYEHFIWNFGLLDNTFNPHVGIKRFFKREGTSYNRELHELACNPDWREDEISLIQKPVLWHLGYVKGVAPIVEKFKMNLEKSTIHSQQYLQDWKNKHLLGTYPVRTITTQDFEGFPTPLKKYLGVN